MVILSAVNSSWSAWIYHEIQNECVFSFYFFRAVHLVHAHFSYDFPSFLTFCEISLLWDLFWWGKIKQWPVSDPLVTPENVHKWNFSIIQCTVAVLLISVMAYLSVLLTEMLSFSDGEVSEDTFEAVVSTNPWKKKTGNDEKDWGGEGFK